jgi:hypothetical protein
MKKLELAGSVGCVVAINYYCYINKGINENLGEVNIDDQNNTSLIKK